MRAFSVAASRIWNAMPTDLKRLSTKATFKWKTKNFCFTFRAWVLSWERAASCEVYSLLADKKHWLHLHTRTMNRHIQDNKNNKNQDWRTFAINITVMYKFIERHSRL